MANKKKIGILTLHKCLTSFGCALQGYATWKFLTDAGYKADIIDITNITQPDYVESKRFPSPLHVKWVNCMHGLLVDVIKNPLRNYRFYKFNNLLSYSKKYRKVDYIYDNPPDYDVYLTGSDQTWNPCLVDNVEPYLLTFVDKTKKKVSYAASFGINELPHLYYDIYKKALLEYNHISVREQRGKEIVKDITGREDVSVALDPTMLLECEHYQRLAKSVNKKDYVLAFFLNRDYNLMKRIEEFAEIKKNKLVIVGHKMPGLKATFIPEAGPREWLGLINEARYVLTDSFHGTVFSLLFRRPFRTFIFDKSKASRIYTLLDSFDLNNHMSFPFDGLSLDEASFHYESNEVEKKLNILRERSREWLIEAVEN